MVERSQSCKRKLRLCSSFVLMHVRSGDLWIAEAQFSQVLYFFPGCAGSLLLLWGLSLVVVSRFLIGMAFLVVEHRF